MSFTALYTQLVQNKAYLFSREYILAFFPEERRGSLKKALYRWCKAGWITPLKRGLYELTYPQDLALPDLLIANRLYAPSYVSLETALSYYNIIPEVAMAVTSITTKPTRHFKNKHGLFVYRTVKTSSFRGYRVEKYREFEVLIAEPEKALVDTLYFKTYRGQKMDWKSERFDKSVIHRLNKSRLDAYARLYGMNWKQWNAHLRFPD